MYGRFVFIRLVLLLPLIIHCIALLTVNATEQSFTLESSVSIKLLFMITICATRWQHTRAASSLRWK